MEQICVATDDGRAYYLIASRLRRARVSFRSVMPSEIRSEECDMILTTRRETKMFNHGVMAIEDLDENPLIMKGQIMAKLGGVRRELVIGIDPGSRIGLAVFYAGAELASQTFNSKVSLYKTIFDLVRRIPNSGSVVKIGNGSPELANKLAFDIGESLADVAIEIVNEERTSVRDTRYRRLPKDQSAAARIALRKGVRYKVV